MLYVYVRQLLLKMIPHNVSDMLIQYQRDLSAKARSFPVTRIPVQDQTDCNGTLQTNDLSGSRLEEVNTSVELIYRIC